MFLVSAGLSAALLGIFHRLFIYSFILENFGKSIQGSLIEHMIATNRVGSVFGWPGLFAGFLMLIIPLAFGMMFLVDTKRERLYVIATVATLFLAMFLTYTISACLSLVTAILICVSLYVRDSASVILKKKFKIIMATLGLLFLILILLIISNRINAVTSDSFQARVMYLKSAILIIKNHPLIGTGLNTYKVLNPNFIPRSMGYSSYAHNSYLQIWGELGIFGFLIFLSIITYVLRSILRGAYTANAGKEKIFLFGIFCAVLAFCIDNLFNFTILLPDTALFWWVFLSICFAWLRQGNKIKGEGSLIASPHTNRAICAVIVFVLLANSFCLIRLYKADRYLRAAIELLKTPTQDKTLFFLAKAKKENPLDGRMHEIEGISYIKKYKVTKDAKELEHAKSAFEKAIELRPTVASNYARLGQVYAAKGDKEKAKGCYVEAAKLAPYNKSYRKQ